MPKYKLSGEANRKGDWRRLQIEIEAPNEKIAVVRATQFLHKIDKKVIRL